VRSAAKSKAGNYPSSNGAAVTDKVPSTLSSCGKTMLLIVSEKNAFCLHHRI
jgi:hypothetical protein